jgi:hypothetical protein
MAHLHAPIAHPHLPLHAAGLGFPVAQSAHGPTSLPAQDGSGDLLAKLQNLEQENSELERLVEDLQSQIAALNARLAGHAAHDENYRELVGRLHRIANVCKDLNLDESPE